LTAGGPIALGHALQQATERVAGAGSLSPKLDVELLAEFIFGFDRTRQIINRDKLVSEEQLQSFWDVIDRRCNLEPVAYIIGEQEFWSLPFRVNAHTLIPRPDTDTLVETVLTRLKPQDSEPLFLDIGTGSGCILLSLLSEYPAAKGIGCDLSSGALAVAKENADKLCLAMRADFLEIDILNASAESLLSGKGGYDCILSNPPYIPDVDVDGLMRDVKEYEPLSALKGGDDGLVFYRRISALSATLLKVGGLLAFEVGIGQADDVKMIMETAGFNSVAIQDDLAGVARVVSGYFGG
jgi:release factor glutamine methyltransferase